MTSLSGKRICVLTTGHLSTSPRMTKAADAFAEAGARVHVISTLSTHWAVEADRDILKRRAGRWTWEAVDYRSSNRLGYLVSGARQRVATRVARSIGAERSPLKLAAFARERVFPEIMRRAARIDADLVYGGGAGLAAAAYAGSKMRIPFGVDLEDFHTADQDRTPAGRLVESLSGRIERDVLRRAAFRTAGSEEIAGAYRKLYDLEFVPVNNAFSLAGENISKADDSRPLRLYWFSQTIGAGRGLEDAVRALGVAGIEAELHLQGLPVRRYVDSLHELAADAAPRMRLIEHAPCFPDDMVAACASYDVGLALETDDNLNHLLCLSNKALAYAAAGMAIVLTNTPGQQRLGRDLGAGGFLYRAGEVEVLAARLASWSEDRNELRRAKKATIEAARARWNWDRPEEKGTLLEVVAGAIQSDLR